MRGCDSSGGFLVFSFFGLGRFLGVIDGWRGVWMEDHGGYCGE